MALLDRLGELELKDQDPVKTATAHKLWEDGDQRKGIVGNRHSIIFEQVQPAIDKSYFGLDKIVSGVFTPEDKKTDPTFRVNEVKIKGKKNEIYKTLNSFVETYLKEAKEAKFAGALEAGKLIKEEKERFQFYAQLVDQHVGADPRKQFNADQNPTIQLLINAAETYNKDGDAKVEQLKEAIRTYSHAAGFAPNAFEVKSQEWLDDKLHSYTAHGLGLSIKNRLDNIPGWKVEKAEKLVNPANDKKAYVSFVRALNDGQLAQAQQIGTQLGLKYQANLN